MKTQKVSFEAGMFQFHFVLSKKLTIDSEFNTDLISFGMALERWADDYELMRDCELLKINIIGYFEGKQYQIKFLGVD